MLKLLALNSLTTTDLIFFIMLGVILALVVGVYFLIPVINKKQYQEQRENLKKREEAFHANANAMVEQQPVEQQPVEQQPAEQKPAKSSKTSKSSKSSEASDK